jgi:hypothetical protein
MAFQPVEATCLAELVYTLDSQICENTLYFRQANDYDAGDLLTLAPILVTWWAEELAPILSSSISLIRVVLSALHAQFAPGVVYTTGLPAAGGVNSDPVPNNCAFCVTFTTGLRGRAFRGRNYVPAIPEGNVVFNTLENVTANSIIAAYQNLSPGLPDGTEHVVVSRTVNGVLQMPSALTNQVISYHYYDKIIDSQRRRLPGRGS